FTLTASLANLVPQDGFAGVRAGAQVTINNNGITFSGSALNGGATLTGTLTLVPVDWQTSATITLGPWKWLNDCIRLSPENNGPFTASVGPRGLQVSEGIKLT